MRFNLTSTSSFWGGLTSTYFDRLDKLGFTYTRIPDKNKMLCDDCIIEINDLDELLKLNKNFGEIILTLSVNADALASIEIYDSYRE